MEFSAHRAFMVKHDLASRDISDKTVLLAFGKTPREAFIPKDKQDLAYADKPLFIGEGQTISQPYIVALMTQAIKAHPGMKILEVGTGSGYQAAILCEIGCEVYSIERHKALYERAKTTLKQLGYFAHTYHGDGTLGLAKQAPFDAIIITAAASSLPPTYMPQLKEEGVLVIPIGEEIQKLLKYTKKKNKIITKKICDCRFVPLITGDKAFKEIKGVEYTK